MAYRALASVCLVLAYPVEGQTNPDLPCGSTATFLDFTNAVVTHSNLGGQGPDTDDPEEVRYDKLGTTLDGTPVGLVITAVNDNEYSAANVNNNGLNGKGMGQINVAGSSKALLKFQFINTNTDAPVNLGPAGITFYDVDGGNGGGANQQYEVISVCPADVTVLSDDYNAPSNVPTMLEEASKIVSTCKAYKAKDPISEIPNPESPDNLDDQQLSHTLTEVWKDLSHFEVYFQSVNGAATSGRNFFFTGIGTQMNECPCEDNTCDICQTGDTCAEAIACKLDELTSGFDSNAGEDLTSDEQCSSALASVYAACEQCVECTDAVCDECQCAETTERLLDDAPKGSGAAAERSPLVAALAVCLLAVSGVAAVLAGLRQRASRALAVATAADTQSETDGQLS